MEAKLVSTRRFFLIRNLNSKSAIHIIVFIKILLVLVYAWQTACLNKNYNFFESFYGYAGGQNAYKYSSISPHIDLANLMDLSGSPDATAHPYYYTNNMDLSLLLNTTMAKLGFGKSSYMAANFLTAIGRVLALYLYYFVFMSLTRSSAISIIAILFLATDYLFFDTPLFNAIRGNDFTVSGIFLFGLFSYHEKDNRGFYLNPYFYVCVVALFLSNYSGYWTPVSLFFLGTMSIVFRLLKIRFQDFILMFLFGVMIPFIYKDILLIYLVGLYNSLIIKQMVLSTKMFLPTQGLEFEPGLIYSFYDANRFIAWPFFPLNGLSAAIQQYIWGIKASIFHLHQFIDYGTIFSVLIVFPLILAWTLRLQKYLLEEQKCILLYSAAVILSILLTWVLFPGYYYFMIALNPYLIMPCVSLILSYVIICVAKKYHNSNNSTKVLIIFFIVVIISFRLLNSVYHYQLLPIQKENTPEILQRYTGIPIATTNVNNYPIYHAFTGNYSIYVHESDINKQPPFDVGHSFIVSARDQFETRRYSYPELIVLYTNRFDKFLDEVTFTGKYEKITKARLDRVINQYNKDTLKGINKERILYNDGNLVVIKAKGIDKNKERLYQKLDGIIHSVLDKHLKDDSFIEDLHPLLDDLYEKLFESDESSIEDYSNYPDYLKLKNWVARLHDRRIADEDLYREVFNKIKEYQKDVLSPIKAANFLAGLSFPDGYSIILFFLLAHHPPNSLWEASAFKEMYDTWYSYLPLTLKESAMKIKYYNMRSGPKFDPLKLRIMNKILQTHGKNKIYKYDPK